MSCVSCALPLQLKKKKKSVHLLPQARRQAHGNEKKKMQRAAEIDVLEASVALSSLVRVSAHGIDQSEYGFSISQQEGDEGGFSQDDVSPNLQIFKNRSLQQKLIVYE